MRKISIHIHSYIVTGFAVKAQYTGYTAVNDLADLKRSFLRRLKKPQY